MVNVEKIYSQKLMNPEKAVELIESNFQIVFPTGAGEPAVLAEALSNRRSELKNVVINQILPLRSPAYLDPNTTENIRHNAWFLGGPTRKGFNEGWITATPNYFYELPILIERGNLPVDAVMATVSPMDEHGYFSLSCAVDYTLAAIKQAKVVILEVNKNAPRTLGNNAVHISDVSAVVETDTAIPTLKIPPISEVEENIGNYIAELIPDGATIQVGFGGVPNAVCKALEHKKDLGVHTEMVTDGMVDLYEKGVITNKKKSFHPGKFLGTFVLGTQKLYDFVNNNPAIEMQPVNYTNDPVNIGKNDNLCAVNAAIEVDLLGQCVSETIGNFYWSGTGGQADFGHGANRSKGGKGFISISSTAKNGTVSRIVSNLNKGGVVTTSKNSVDYIVTEYGVAHLRGKNTSERAKQLIAIAHPKFREELTFDAAKRGLI
ncbi:acyl-CoA hydrolase [Desulfitispora alkaliphila]|uniref:acetyl-CoA hydrolase/transferase family protein n=1 Tax=Desulfitispora alkaliphila TaxID=622674 RepID=UPI003D1CA57F